MKAPLVVIAVGNPSRGDDALGPLLLARLAGWLEREGRAGEFELFEDFQLQIEHALDLEGRRLALFLDAGERTPGPYRFYRAAPALGPTHTTHALPPEAVLQVYRRTTGGEPPPSFVLCVRGERFELGEALGPEAESHAEAAWSLLQDLCRRPWPAAWQALAEADKNI